MEDLEEDLGNFSNSTTLKSLGDLEYPPLEALGYPMQVFLITLYSVTAALSLGGNITVIIVLCVGKRSSRELRVFLINLALSDITMAVFSIPFTYTNFMLGQWIFDPAFCPVVQFMQHCSVIGSVYTLTAIGIDRYYAIMHPLNIRWTKSRGNLVILAIWVAAVGMSSVQLVHGRAVQFKWDGEKYYECTEVWGDVSGKVYTVIIFVTTFVLPMFVLTFTYATVGWKMWRHTPPGNADPVRDHQQLVAKMKVVKMLATVVLLFALCWLPIHILNLLIYFQRDLVTADSDEEYYIYIAAFFSCHWLSMANSFVNPIIYCFMSDNFRADLKQLVYCCCPIASPKRPRRVTFPTRSSCYGGSLNNTTTVILTANNFHGRSVHERHPNSFRRLELPLGSSIMLAGVLEKVGENY